MRRKFTKNIGRPQPDSCPPKRQRRREKVYLRTKNSRLRAFLFIGCCFLLTACFDSGDCLITSTNVVKINILDLATPTQAKDMVFDSVFIPDQGYFYNNKDTVSQIFVAIDPRTTETEYVFQYQERSDTLVLSYSNQTIVLSPDCGSYLYQTDLAIKHSTFSSNQVVIKEQSLQTGVAVNIEILF